jgi:carboxypeptidase Taq
MSSPRTPDQVQQELTRRFHEIQLLASLGDLAEWDEQTGMPPQAAEYRAEQLEWIAGEVHRRSTDKSILEMLDLLADSHLSDDPHSGWGANIRRLRTTLHKQAKVPQRLIEELAKLTALGQQVWSQARRDDNFPAFRPYLEKIVARKREYAETVGYAEVPYDALLDDYEPEALTREVASVLNALRDDLVPLVAEITESTQQVDDAIVMRHYPADIQARFARRAAEQIGFDFGAGRVDVSAHPFCTTLGPRDVRLTTRYDEHHFNEAFFGVLHEAGHGMYEQGLPAEFHGLPAGEHCSMGVHESQSRLWENFVGRGRPFWEYFFPLAQREFGTPLADVSLEQFHAAVNCVRPSLIRTDADEVTYNLHVLIRFELEQELIAGRLTVTDLRDAWATKYEQSLGVAVPNDANGVLQDIHWSGGMIGYFPTYTLGNVYAAQLFEAARRDLGDLDAMFRVGEFVPLLTWLREKVHQFGQCYPATQLIERATGEALSHKPLVRYLRDKYSPPYGL